MKLNFEHLERSTVMLGHSLDALVAAEESSLSYLITRMAVIKSFELSLETAGRLLSKVLRFYSISAKSADALTFKEVFREGARLGLLSVEEVERWLSYRDFRNLTAHQYSEHFSDDTLLMLRDFQRDALALHQTLVQKHG